MLKCEYLIVGAGESGVELALKLAKSGKEVILVEQERVGSNYIYKTDFPKKLLIKKAKNFETSLRILKDYTQAYKNLSKYRSSINKDIKESIRAEAKKIESKIKNVSNIKVIKGKAEFSSQSLVEVNSKEERHLIGFEKCVLTIGKQGRDFVEIKGGFPKTKVWTEDNIYLLPAIPEKLGIVGLTQKTLEIAHIYSNLGVKVQIFEKKPSRLCLPDLDRTALNYTLKRLIEKQVVINFDWEVVKVTNPRKNFILTNSDAKKEKVSHLFIPSQKKFIPDDLNLDKITFKVSRKGLKTDSVGRIQNEKSYCRNIYAIGECNYSVDQGKRYAYYQRFLSSLSRSQSTIKSLVSNLKSSYRGIKSPIFFVDSVFSIFSVGFSETLAISKYGPQAKVKIIEDNSIEGFVKIIFREPNREIIGISLAGDYVKKFSGVAVYFVENGKTLSGFVDLANSFVEF